MKAFVTGGTGFVGSHLVEALLEQGVEVYALIRDLNKPGWLNGLNLHFLKGDLFSIPSLPRDLDAVFHLAGLTKTTTAAEYYTVNYLGTANLFQSLSCQKLTPRVIYVSSISASGPSADGQPVREDDLPHPVSPYGRSKLLAEREALRRKDEMPLIILRPGVIFGPRDRDMVGLMKLLQRGILLKMFGGRLRISQCYVKDVVRALLLCLHRQVASGEIFHIAAADPPSVIEIGRRATILMGQTPRPIALPRKLLCAAAFSLEKFARIAKRRPSFNMNLYLEMKEENWVADVRKAAEQLAFRAETPLEEALAETINWYRQQSWI